MNTLSDIIMPNDIGDALESVLREKFPGEEVYRELTPSGFARPNNLVVLGECKVVPAFACGIVEMRPTVTITTFVEVDEYHHSHLNALHARQMKIAGLMMAGYIKVGNRAPHVVDLVLDGNYDSDSVTVTFSYTLSREEFMTMTQYPMMGELHLNEEVKN